jgi:hypothetical protein
MCKKIIKISCTHINTFLSLSLSLIHSPYILCLFDFLSFSWCSYSWFLSVGLDTLSCGTDFVVDFVEEVVCL